jgi:hypothetical protein
MSQELSLIMKTPVEELIPAMLAWNNQELMEAVENALMSYEGITYTDEQMDAAKKDRASLNAFVKALNDERIRIGKVYAAPYDKFKAEVDEVIAKVKSAVAQIDEQVKTYENERQRKKLEQVKAYFVSVIGDFAELIPFEKVLQSKWLNASTSMKSIKADIDKIIADAAHAMSAIEALKSQDEQVVKAYYFRTLNLSDALMENGRLQQERDRIAELQARQEAEAKARAEAQAAATPPPKAPEVAPVEAPKLIPMDFHVEATLDQLKKLKAFLVENGIKYSKI